MTAARFVEGLLILLAVVTLLSMIEEVFLRK